ncbi:hypothetical protein E2C01_047791 [Portunus trituberculatus]|uniref:Uncharacterized protein n=1 Tax=Portunus trituberculatus TaxID=210409 RepID=A0A5B7G9S9_PORTR|nr:hypothetical protein [Portunus trituberculatus]
MRHHVNACLSVSAVPDNVTSGHHSRHRHCNGKTQESGE